MTEITIDRQIIYVTGLPRAGSTLMCQLLGHHPQIYSIVHSQNYPRKKLTSKPLIS